MSSDLLKTIRDECYRIEEDTEHSFKAHFNSAAFWSRWNLGLGLTSAVLGAIAGGVSSIDGAQYIVVTTSLIASALVTCLTFLKPGEKADSHKNAGSLYQSLRNNARIFRTVEIDTASDPEKLKENLYKLVERRDELNSIMPNIPRFAYEKAKQDIDAGRATYCIDQESR